MAQLMTTPTFDFGSKVKVLSSEVTDQLELTGLEGTIYGFSDPTGCHLSSEEIIVGKPDLDSVIYSVHFETIDAMYWLSPQLLEISDAMPPLEMKMGDKHIKRDESGVWFEKDLEGNWIQIESKNL